MLKKADTDADGSLDQQRIMLYSAAWQVLEERIDDAAPFSLDPETGQDRTMQYVWGVRYIDDLVLRREDANFNGSYADNEDSTWFHLTDAQFSTVAVIDNAGNLIERVSYDAYGQARHHWPEDVDGDGDHDSADRSLIYGIYIFGGANIADQDYNVDADLNRDGEIDGTDYTLSAGSNPALSTGALSSVDSVIGFSGYVYNAECRLYLVRFRCYCTTLGRWLERDPLQYVDGANLYGYVDGQPLVALDPFGLEPKWYNPFPEVTLRGPVDTAHSPDPPAGPRWLRTLAEAARLEQRVLYGCGPAQVGFDVCAAPPFASHRLHPRWV